MSFLDFFELHSDDLAFVESVEANPAPVVAVAVVAAVVVAAVAAVAVVRTESIADLDCLSY